jgi:glutamyl-tRNA synthetase
VKREVDTRLITEMIQPRCEKLSDIPDQLDFIDVLPEYSVELYISKKMKTTPESSLEALKAALAALEAIVDWKKEIIHTILFDMIAKMGVKNGAILWPVRVAVSGKQFTPGGGIEICTLLGREESLKRIEKGIELLSV